MSGYTANIDKNRTVNLLVVDDDPEILKMASRSLNRGPWKILTASSGREALDVISKTPLDLVLLDLKLPDYDGLELFRRITARDKDLPVVFITGNSSMDTAVEAMKLGAHDYIAKPFDLAEVREVIHRALRNCVKGHQCCAEESEVYRASDPHSIVGKDRRMLEVFKTVGKVADTGSAVLIRGETGTGKELVARAIHHNSSRKDKPFIAIDCSFFPHTLLETELFGHEKGAFTGAFESRKGKFEMAEGGTLFLDEIGNISLHVQAKLLRFLQEKTFYRIGGDRVSVDTRIIAATNINLEQAVIEKSFRDDLYYRLNVVSIELPPLRKRNSDIPKLADYFLSKYSKSVGKQIAGFSPEAYSLIMQHHWPGNVRELENAVESAVAICRGNTIVPDDLSFKLLNHNPDKNRQPLILEDDLAQDGAVDLPELLQAIEKRILARALNQTGWNLTKTARNLGISFRSLRYKVAKLGLKKMQGKS
jgi:DNA-binding NtrC family response regulator